MSQMAIDLHTKHSDSGITTIDGPRRTMTIVASVEAVDRDHEVISVGGIETQDFVHNPVFLADHDPTAIIGHVTDLWTEWRAEGKALMATVEMLPAGISARADEIWQAIQHGSRRGISIGFIPLEAGPPIFRGQTGLTFYRISLLEISSVAIPSCPTCLITAKSHKEETMASRYCDPHEDLDITPAQLASIPAIARRIINENIAQHRGNQDFSFDPRWLSMVPGIVNDMLAQEIGWQVGAAIRRLQGRVD